MDDKLTRRAGKYWVMFYQPLPEAGERIAIALVFQGIHKGAAVEYDPTFSKVAKVFPDIDSQALVFLLDSLRSDLADSDQVELVLNQYGPQIAASAARKIAVPLSAAAIEMLMTRYVLPARRRRRDPRQEDKIGREIEAFVRHNVQTPVDVRTEVTAREILGRSVPGIKRVALAIHNPSGWTLVDGVDLNQLTPQAAANRADEVSRTFWNYSRAVEGTGTRIQRVGVVLTAIRISRRIRTRLTITRCIDSRLTRT